MPYFALLGVFRVSQRVLTNISTNGICGATAGCCVLVLVCMVLMAANTKGWQPARILRRACGFIPAPILSMLARAAVPSARVPRSGASATRLARPSALAGTAVLCVGQPCRTAQAPLQRQQHARRGHARPAAAAAVQAAQAGAQAARAAALCRPLRRRRPRGGPLRLRELPAGRNADPGARRRYLCGEGGAGGRVRVRRGEREARRRGGTLRSAAGGSTDGGGAAAQGVHPRAGAGDGHWRDAANRRDPKVRATFAARRQVRGRPPQ